MINHVNIVWENAYATDYKLQVSNTADSGYVDMYENKAGMGMTEDLMAPTFTPKAGQYLRMQGVTRKLAAYGYSIYEITVYGDTDAGCTP
jgi:mannan endo-1,4-beta-mannosidase